MKTTIKSKRIYIFLLSTVLTSTISYGKIPDSADPFPLTPTMNEKNQDFFETINPKNNDFLQEKVSLHEREILFSESTKLANSYENNLKQQEKLQNDLAEKEKVILAGCLRNNVDRDLLRQITSQPDALINTLDSEQVSALGNLARVVYEDFDLSSVKFQKTEQQMVLDEKIASETIILDALKYQKEQLEKSIREPNGLNKKLDGLVKDISRIDSTITLKNKDDLAAISKKLSAAISKRERHLQNLKSDQKIQEDMTLKAAQDLLDKNLMHTGQYRVAGVFYRNNGEFSGLALYNEEENKLTLAFAGSKSRFDWIKNFFGWNAYADAKGGYFSDIKFHAGFISHFNDSFDSVMSGVNRWVEGYQKNPQNKPLTIEGTGHSLGGTQAAIFALAAKQLFEKKGIDAKVQAVTFGAPNLAHGASIEKLNSLFGGSGNFIRFEDANDIVPVAAFWKDNPGISVRYNPGFFHDINGNLEIVPRNTHSSEDYYRFASNAWKAWKSNVNLLKPFAKEITDTQKTMEDLKIEQSRIIKKSNENMLRLSNLDAKNYETFLIEFESYAAEMKTKVLDIQKKARELMRNKDTPPDAQQLEMLYQEGMRIKSRIAELKKSVNQWKKTSDEINAKREEKIKSYEDIFNNLNNSLTSSLSVGESLRLKR